MMMMMMNSITPSAFAVNLSGIVHHVIKYVVPLFFSFHFLLVHYVLNRKEKKEAQLFFSNG